MKYIVFEAPNTTTPLQLPQNAPPLAIITKDFPPYVRDVPSIHIPDTVETFSGIHACTAFLDRLQAPPPAPVDIPAIAQDLPTSTPEDAPPSPRISIPEVAPPLSPSDIQPALPEIKVPRKKKTPSKK